MTELDLEQRLQRSDPMRGEPVDPADGAGALALRDRIMATPVPAIATDRRRRWPVLAAAGAAAALAVGIGVGVAVNASRSSDPAPITATYELQAGDPMAMCLAITDAPPPPPTAVAFAGTVTAVSPERADLAVDRTYAGAPVDVVSLALSADMPSVALDGVEFVAGQRYLVTVVDGVVQICGASGPATPELEAVYARWYGA